jgi:hypothetical protein
MSVKFTDAQLAMLSAAAQRKDLCLTAPDKMKGAILTKVSERLVKLGLVREVRAWRASRVTISMGCAANGAPIWAASRLLISRGCC